MPKDLTKLSLKELEAVSGGEFDQRTRWVNGTLELTVFEASSTDFEDDDVTND